MPRATPPPPLQMLRTLRDLGAGISTARRRRRIPTETLARRALISRPTLQRVEQGDPSVAMGTYASVLFALGLGGRLDLVADPGADAVGLELEQDRLPQRIRRPRREKQA